MQRRRLDVEASGQDHVAIEAADQFILGVFTGLEGILLMRNPHALWSQQLHQICGLTKGALG
ncbi:MAG: hypothetical protein R2709_09760 [Marmoricola sp.]